MRNCDAGSRELNARAQERWMLTLLALFDLPGVLGRISRILQLSKPLKHSAKV
jgi:hypothetical protein